MQRILLIEDADSLREVLGTILESAGYAVSAYANAEDALRAISKESYVAILSDFKLPGMNGIDLLKAVRRGSPSVPFIIMTAYGSIEIAVEAMREGANDFITKPFEPEYICHFLKEIISNNRIVDRRIGRELTKQREIVTQDSKMLEIIEQAKRVARFESSVLILGESGTGKELLARLIHANGPRNQENFVSINCAAMPAELLESEFFGHEAGAFTGATQSRIGLFEYASDGTIFLDEIGEMPAVLQVKLLRALQEREIRRVGGNKPIKVNPRVLAATNRNIEQALSNGELREDLYYRLAVISFDLPPLRERSGDVALLCEYFIRKFAEKENRIPPALNELALDILQTYKWPGNARELENVIERATIMADELIGPEHLGINLSLDFQTLEDATSTLPQIVSQATRRTEIDLILKALKQTEGNKTRAAERLGVSYKTLLNKMKEYELNAS